MSKKVEMLSFLTREEAEQYAKSNSHYYKVEMVGTTAFPTPDGIDQWSGETNAFCLYDEDYKVIAYVAFWE